MVKKCNFLEMITLLCFQNNFEVTSLYPKIQQYIISIILAIFRKSEFMNFHFMWSIEIDIPIMINEAKYEIFCGLSEYFQMTNFSTLYKINFIGKRIFNLHSDIFLQLI